MSTSPASAQVFEAVGVRALGMGGAFVAVADDATAAYWNPAGLATGAFLSLLIDRPATETRSDRDQPDAPAVRGSSTIVSLSTTALGLTYYRLRSNRVEDTVNTGAEPVSAQPDQRFSNATLGSLVTHHVGITSVRAVAEGVAVGSTLKLVRARAALQPRESAGAGIDLLDQAADLNGRASHAFDVDVGAMVTFGRARAGLVVRNLRAPAFETTSGARLELSRQLRAGVAVMPNDRLTLAVDADLNRTATPAGGRRNLAVGAEHWGQWWGVRAGLRVNTVAEARPVAAAGLSVAVRAGLWLDAQVTRGHRNGDRGWGLAGRVGF